MTIVKSVPEALADLGKIYKERRAIYGPTDKNFGTVLMGMFPNGIEIKTANDANRFALLSHCIDKMMRYATAFPNGGHVDSLDDLSTYSMMLQQYDAELREVK